MDTSGSSHANGEDHVKDMNKFMAHIGVCYFFVRYKFRIVILPEYLTFFKKKGSFLDDSTAKIPRNSVSHNVTDDPTAHAETADHQCYSKYFLISRILRSC